LDVIGECNQTPITMRDQNRDVGLKDRWFINPWGFIVNLKRDRLWQDIGLDMANDAVKHCRNRQFTIHQITPILRVHQMAN
jgi:hypothetical protein